MEGSGKNPSDANVPLSDKPLATFRTELLELAFKSVSKFPIDPHLKNRSRAQEAVVATCFELDQPQRALGYLKKIDNWRRGSGFADYAFYCVQQGDTSEAEHYLNLAGQIAENEHSQEWRRDQIRAKIARTYLLLEEHQKAARLGAGLVDSEAGKVDTVKAMTMDANAFDDQMKVLEGVFATGNFDQMRNALATCAQLFNRFYEDGERRSRVEEMIKDSWDKLPGLIRFEVMMELVRFALDHEDQGKAAELVEETQQVLEGIQSTPEYLIPLRGRLAELRCRAGDKEKARSDLDGALAVYEASRDKIVNIYRAGVLRPLAEAYHTMGRRDAALKVYKRAVEEGVENPNSRPRANDLSATCCSMAKHGIEPDAELWARLYQICDELDHPW